jgi:hypothetical protein
MSDPIIITVPYKNTEQQFEIELEARGYTHRFKVMINELPVYFEPDEEKQYRAIITEEHAKNVQALDPVLLQSIAATLEKELS